MIRIYFHLLWVRAEVHPSSMVKIYIGSQIPERTSNHFLIIKIHRQNIPGLTWWESECIEKDRIVLPTLPPPYSMSPIHVYTLAYRVGLYEFICKLCKQLRARTHEHRRAPSDSDKTDWYVCLKIRKAHQKSNIPVKLENLWQETYTEKKGGQRKKSTRCLIQPDMWQQ